MNNITVTPALLGFVVGTRAMLAFGIGLLVANRIPEPRRRAMALAMIGLGVVTTVPAAKSVFGHRANRLPPNAADEPQMFLA